MKRISIRCLVVLGAIAPFIPLATSAAAQATVVVGTGNPDIDVPAVQAAVDQSGEVILKGHFSFNRTPTVPTALAGAGYPPATILVSKAVTISGEGDGDDMTTIEGGTIPLYVEAMGAAVTIHALRFVRPQMGAIVVYAVSGLTQIGPEEVAIVRRFGRPLDDDLGPGLHWRWPWPVEDIARIRPNRIYTVEVGFGYNGI